VEQQNGRALPWYRNGTTEERAISGGTQVEPPENDTLTPVFAELPKPEFWRIWRHFQKRRKSLETSLLGCFLPFAFSMCFCGIIT
jgi:hypothetical protein